MRSLFLVLDTVRRDYLRAYGADWVHTPNLTRLAERGVTFDNHWVGSLPCMPARREFMTGRHNFLYRGWGPIEPFDDILPRALRREHVFSHLLTDHFHYYELGGENYHTGFSTWDFHRGQEHDPWASFVDRLALPEHLGQLSQPNWCNRQRMQKEEEFSGPRTIQAAVEWLEVNGRSERDWFLQVELFDPHEPFYCTEEYRALYGDDWDGPLFDWPDYNTVKESPEAVAHIRKCYAGLLTMTDHWIGKLLDRLDELNLWDDLLLIFTTDHGTMLAEHGYWMKNFMPMYNEIVRIPLIVCLPGGERAGTRCAALTQSIDVMPSLLDYHGAPLPPYVQGRSLRRSLEGDVRTDGIFGYFGKALNITDGRCVYMRNPINEDGGPLFAYTAMPVGGLNHWYPREVYDRVEMGRYFGHTYNLPLYKIPAQGQAPKSLPGEPDYIARHQLFDIEADPLQNAPLEDAALEAHFIERIKAHLAECEAPSEQYERLGL